MDVTPTLQMKEQLGARNIENRRGEFQTLIKEGWKKFLCDNHLNLILYMFVKFLKMFRGAQDTFVHECFIDDVINLYLVKLTGVLRHLEEHKSIESRFGVIEALDLPAPTILPGIEPLSPCR